MYTLIHQSEEVIYLLKSIDLYCQFLINIIIINFFNNGCHYIRVYKCLICNDDKYNELNKLY